MYLNCNHKGGHVKIMESLHLKTPSLFLKVHQSLHFTSFEELKKCVKHLK